MDLNKWIEKYTAGFKAWVQEMEANLNVDLGDADDPAEESAEK